MKPKTIADRLADLPRVESVDILKPIVPSLAPTSVEAVLPGGFAILVTPTGDDDGLEVQIENRPHSRWAFDDTDCYGDPFTVSGIRGVQRAIDDFLGTDYARRAIGMAENDPTPPAVMEAPMPSAGRSL